MKVGIRSLQLAIVYDFYSLYVYVCYSLYVYVCALDVGACGGQREEGRIQGQLNHSDSSQYIRELKDQIEELKTEVRARDSGHRPNAGAGTQIKHEAKRVREEGA